MLKIYSKNTNSPLDRTLTIKTMVLPSAYTLKVVLGYAAAYRTLEGRVIPRYEMMLN